VREGRVKYKGKIKVEREKRNNFISKCTKGESKSHRSHGHMVFSFINKRE
jgi:hypothetical protein